jgi:hypothetical protein
MCCGLAPGRVGAVRTCPPESRDLDWSAVKPAGAAISALSLVPVTGTAAAVFSSGACAWPGTAWLDVVPDAPQPAIARASMTGTVPALLARATSAGSFLTTHPRSHNSQPPAIWDTGQVGAKPVKLEEAI